MQLEFKTYRKKKFTFFFIYKAKKYYKKKDYAFTVDEA